MSLFDAVAPAEMQAARVLTGLTIAAFIAVGFARGMRPYARTIRLVLLAAYLAACAAFLAVVLLR